MSKKEKFIEVVENLFRKTDMETFAGEDYEDVMLYFEALKGQADTERPAFTENGKAILNYLKDNVDINLFTAKSLGESMGISSKTVSGAMRKLTSDGYVEKLGSNPATYTLTEKGKEVKLEEA